jgi:hypothetical protein
VICGDEVEMITFGLSNSDNRDVGISTKEFGQDDGGNQLEPWSVPDGDFIVTFTIRHGARAGGCQFSTQNGVSSPWFGSREGEEFTFHARNGYHITGFIMPDTIVDFDLGTVSATNAKPDAIEESPLPQQETYSDTVTDMSGDIPEEYFGPPINVENIDITFDPLSSEGSPRSPAPSSPRDVNSSPRDPIAPSPRESPRDVSVTTASYADIVADGQLVLADKLVTHWWGNVFTDFIAAVLADALQEKEYQDIATKLEDKKFDDLRLQLRQKNVHELRYWMCPFAVNQHTGISPGVQCEVDKTEAVITYLKGAVNQRSLSSGSGQRFEQLIVIDKSFKLVTRVCCLAEIAEAYKQHVHQVVKYHSKQAVKETLKMIEAIDVDSAEASVADDKNRILAKIDNKTLFNKRVRNLIAKRITPLLGANVVAGILGKAELADALLPEQ